MRGFFEGTSSEVGDPSSNVLVFPDYVEDVVLAADTLLKMAIPATAKWAVFSFDGDFRAKLGVSASDLTLPAASTSNGSGSELNPTARRIPQYLTGTTVPTHILIRAAGAIKGSVSFYK